MHSTAEPPFDQMATSKSKTWEMTADLVSQISERPCEEKMLES